MNNLVRFLKLKKLLGDTDKEIFNEKENIFLSLFDGLSYDYGVFHKNGHIFFYIDLEKKLFFYSSVVISKLNIKGYYNIKIFITDLLNIKFNMNEFKIFSLDIVVYNRLKLKYPHMQFKYINVIINNESNQAN